MTDDPIEPTTGFAEALVVEPPRDNTLPGVEGVTTGITTDWFTQENQAAIERLTGLLDEKQVQLKSLRFAANQPAPLETALLAALRPAIKELIDDAVESAVESAVEIAVEDALNSRLEDLQIEVESTATVSL